MWELLGEAKLLIHCLISVPMCWLAVGNRVGARGINFPTSCLILKHFTKALKICRNISPNSFGLLNVDPFRRLFASLPCIFCVRASSFCSVLDACICRSEVKCRRVPVRCSEDVSAGILRK